MSSPAHVRQWWPDEADYVPTPGAVGTIAFGDPQAGGAVAAFGVVEVDPPRTFSFRWTQPIGEPAVAGNSLLVTFELQPSGAGTLLRMTETGFREMGWERAVLEEQHHEHVTGWDWYLPRLKTYTAALRVGS